MFPDTEKIIDKAEAWERAREEMPAHGVIMDYGIIGGLGANYTIEGGERGEGGGRKHWEDANKKKKRDTTQSPRLYSQIITNK